MSETTGVAGSELGEGAPAKTDPTYAWALALLPLAGIPFVLMANPWGWVAAGAVAVLTVVLAFADARQLKKAGVAIEAGVAILGGIWYLTARTKRAGSTPAMPVVWVVAAAGWVAAFYWLAPSAYDSNSTEVMIEDWARDQGVYLDVDCPAIEGSVGDSVFCEGASSDGPVTIRVTIEEDDYLSWSLD